VAALGDRSDIKARNEYINRYTFGRKRADAKRFAEVWKERYPNAPVPKNIEVYEISEYGRAPTKDEIKLFRGM
jgi:hypothetical protein